MMKTVTLRKEQIYQGDLLLVNARHPYRDNSRKFYVSLNSRYEETLLSREAANALQLIFQKISSGNAIVPVSGYRTLEEQVNIYNTSLKDNGEEFTRKYVALPNHSEHQTGLAIDLGLNKPDIDFIRPDFPYGGICEEFRQAAPDYGFIERYAKDKESITGISHEPWHFRYVGFSMNGTGIMNIQSLPRFLYTVGRQCPRNRWRKRYFGTYDMRPCTELLSNCPKYRDGGSYYITLWGLHTHKSLKRRVVPFRPSGNPYRRLKKD